MKFDDDQQRSFRDRVAQLCGWLSVCFIALFVLASVLFLAGFGDGGELLFAALALNLIGIFLASIWLILRVIEKRFRKKVRILWTLVLFILGPGSIIALMVGGCNGTSEPTDATTLAQCYATEFGTMPPAGVKNIRAKQTVIGDSAEAWLRFEADSNIFSQIISNHFTHNGDRFCTWSDAGYQHKSRPPWWSSKVDALTNAYMNTQWRPGSNYSVAVIFYDPTNRLVYFHHGISF